MTVSELIADLEARPWVHSSFEPQQYCVTPNGYGGDIPANLNTYQRGILEENNGVLKKSTVRFYVLDEGTADEQAWYADGEPQPTVQTNTFRDWLKVQLFTKMQAGEIKSFRLKEGTISEEADIGAAAVSVPNGEGAVKWIAYQCYRVNDALVMDDMGMTSEQVLAFIA